jgi:hypothetical protein
MASGGRDAREICLRPFRFLFTKIFFLAAIFREPEGLYSVCTPVIAEPKVQGRLRFLVCSDKGSPPASPARITHIVSMRGSPGPRMCQIEMTAGM